MDEGVFFHLLDEDYGSEAMTSLVRLDKGLRSNVVSQQCESVLQCAQLIQSNPLPIIINTALLKLSDLFKNSDNNFIRFMILKAFDSIQHEIPKVLNRVEILKRISFVLSSNDPIARGHTLRLLGIMSLLIIDKSEILVKIQSRLLETHDTSELEASISAMDKICEISPDYALQVMPKLMDRILQIETPISIKIRLIQILAHVHHVESLENLQVLAKIFPNRQILLVILKVIGTLCCKSILLSKNVFDFFNSLLKNEFRNSIRVQVLIEMWNIVKLGPDTFYRYLDMDLIMNLMETIPFYQIFSILKCIASNLDAQQVKLIVPFLYHRDSWIRLSTCEILLKWSHINKNVEYSKDIMIAICLGSTNCKYVHFLIETHLNTFQCGHQEFYSISIQWIKKGQESHLMTLCKIIKSCPNTLDLTPFHTIHPTKYLGQYFECLFSLTNKTSHVGHLNHVFKDLVSREMYWHLYKFAQIALLHGHFEIASESFQVLVKRVKKSQNLLWIHGFIAFCQSYKNPISLSKCVLNFKSLSPHISHSFLHQYCQWRESYSNPLESISNILKMNTQETLWPRHKMQFEKLHQEMMNLNQGFKVFVHSWMDMDESSLKLLVSQLQIYFRISSHLNPYNRTELDKEIKYLDKIGIPKYIFETRCNMSLEMEIEIEKKQYANQIITIGVGNGLVLMISGYIKHGNLPRTPKSVLIQIEYGNVMNVLKSPIIHDGFSTRTMCRFEKAGNFPVTVSCRLVDVENQEWFTSAKQIIKVVSRFE